MTKIVTILGARPQFIKAGSVSREILKQQNSGKNINEVIVHTGQHYDDQMSDIFFKEMHIPKPEYFLGIGDKTHGAMTGQMIEKIESVLADEEPNWVIVYGDTNSTLAGAIAASKLHIKIAHVEAGLRSFNLKMPEEVNRILTDRISSLLLCPTKTAVNNLEREGIDYWKSDAKLLLSGDVMLDSSIFYKKLSKKPSNIEISDKYLLCTIHRAENTDKPTRLKNIFEALREISKSIQIILPLHPRTSKIIESSNIDTGSINIINPVGYLNMIWLIDNSTCVMTDSGGLQKEAYFFDKNCITLRDETEWVELVEVGANKIVGAEKDMIIMAFEESIKTKNFKFDSGLYGDGRASERIVSELIV